MINLDQLIVLLFWAAVLCAGAVAVEYGIRGVYKLGESFRKGLAIVDAPSDHDTEYDRRWKKTYNRSEVYDQETM